MDFASIFFYDTTWVFVFEILIRCVVMYLLIILFLRLTGKRGVRQLSIFEVAIILCLGSIAGDPMFTEDLPLIQAVVVMSVIILLYRTTTWLMMKYQPFEDLVEGKSCYIVKDGMLVLEAFKQGNMSHDEFFSEMRRQSVEHLGQIRVGLLESDGNFSILFYPDEQVKYGLPIFPDQAQSIYKVKPSVIYACTHCGFCTELQQPLQDCPRCSCQDWTQAINSLRIG